ncbi:ATP-binding cassette domain-containing protein [Helicobacter sp. 13S00477-4]|uniref:ABC transporter ATP-binding protein n=1 Tax=Helicobacter sp. 13S00477-4 TaxID=1905759 RepID=UPI000BA5EE16|nr:ATP-binding cassette domain-containing protein [Helicobacter sp. 13S00477-4]PAF52847.1 hypothetical protein BKH44_01310 [Helicobacter sp. 13S00477-4]
MTYLQLQGIYKGFDDQKVLRGIDFCVNEGEFVSMLGPSGCGKSTLLRIIAGLEYPDKGKIFLKDTEITFVPPMGRKFGMLFQSYALFPNMNVYQNLQFPLKECGFESKKISSLINQSLELVGLEGSEHKMPFELSGGQQQRVAIARALSLKPRVLLLDEPLSALDAKVRVKLRRDIKKIQRELGMTTIMVTHDQEEAIGISDKIAILNNGKILQIATPKELYLHPKDYFSAVFIGQSNQIRLKKHIYVIRPENVEISRIRGKFEAKIKDIEFFGNFFRVTLKPKWKWDKAIISNLFSRDFYKLDLEIGERVFFNIEKKYFLKYKVPVW